MSSQSSHQQKESPMSDTEAPSDPTHDPSHGGPFGQPLGTPEPEADSAPIASPNYTSLAIYKTALIAGLAVATPPPNLFLSNLIEERQQRQDGVLQELTRTWGPEQSL